jgi:predicted dehydrogenase
MRIAIVGCGLVGNKRARALGNSKLVVAVDTDLERAAKLAAKFPGCDTSNDWRRSVERADIDAVIVATTNNMLAPIAKAAILAGKHLLLEKPAARSAIELEPISRLARASGVVVKVGFNHRFHPAFRKAREIFDSGVLGPLMYIRARYGHGGRLGYDREWRADAEIAGGGEMLDQGVHLIDLSRWFAGDFVEVSGHVGTYFWDMPVEDDGFALLKTEAGQVAWLLASCTEWKNLFSFEILGRNGKLQVEGLGGSYGVERLSYYKMLPKMGPPETTIWEYPGEDLSWRDEFDYFCDCIESARQPEGGLDDALAALRVIERLYELSSINELKKKPVEASLHGPIMDRSTAE